MDKDPNDQNPQPAQGGWDEEDDAPAETPATTPLARLPNGQFPKGVSGNKNGRTKKVPRAYTRREFIKDFIAEMEREFDVNGEKLSANRVLFRSMINAAVKGNAQALKLLLELIQISLDEVKRLKPADSEELEAAESWMAFEKKPDPKDVNAFIELIKNAKRL
jgi:hypothetical protein